MNEKTQRIDQIVAAHLHLEGPLLPILHEVQKEFGCIDVEAEAHLAQAMNMTRAHMHGVVSFYADFKPKADPRPEVQICHAEACQARGVDALMDDATRAAGDRVNLSTVYCLGLCSSGPAARVGDTLHARLDSTRITKIIENAR